jgi:dipeptidyl aminopeptidase/acylaminoacyl peptidase
VLRGVDLVVGLGYVDPQRLCITGGSYGGYLTAWIIGHDPRFAAACAQRGVFNLISFRGTTDITFFSDMEMGVSPWEDIGKLWEQSPLKHAPNIETPLLLEHSEQDYRVAIEQAEQLFVTLRERRKTVELVRWPREGHELSRAGEPRHRAERIRRIIAWFDRYSAVAPQAAQP